MTTPLLVPTPLSVSTPSAALPAALRELFAHLDRHSSRIPLAELDDRLQRLDLPQAAFSGLTEFDPRRYTRTVLHSGPAYEALLLCWLPDQHSPIHDHRGSSCAFRVLMGTATETVFRLDGGKRAHRAESRELTTGYVAASQDEDVHRVSNLGGEDLVTLHVYSPPMGPMGTYLEAKASGTHH